MKCKHDVIQVEQIFIACCKKLHMYSTHHWDQIKTHLSGFEIEEVGQRRFSSKILTNKKLPNFFKNCKLKNEILKSGKIIIIFFLLKKKKNQKKWLWRHDEKCCNFGSWQHQPLTLTIKECIRSASTSRVQLLVKLMAYFDK